MIEIDNHIRIGPIVDKDGTKDFFIHKDIFLALSNDLGEEFSTWRLMSYADLATIYRKPRGFNHIFPVFSNVKEDKEYTNPDMISWLVEHGGQLQKDWRAIEGKILKNRSSGNLKSRFLVVCFKDSKTALHFKMVWANELVTNDAK